MKNNIIVALLLSSYLVADITFEEWSRRETQSFVNYQTQIDREFIEMLKRDWQEYRAMENVIPHHRPKPKQQPTLRPNQKIKETIQTPPKLFTPIKPPTIPQKIAPTGYQKVNFDFFSIDVEIVYEQKLSYNVTTISSASIANYWYRVSSSNYKSLLRQIREYQEVYHLNSWATYLLVREIAREINHDSSNQNLLTWFILVKLGIDAKVGFSSHSISLLVGSSEKLYGVKYFTLNEKHYYQFETQKNPKLQIYRGDIGSLEMMNFRDQVTKLPIDIKIRELKFAYRDREYRLTARYNQNLVKLYRTYPQLDYNDYGQLSMLGSRFIHQELLPIISQMSQIEAINFLLRLTQNGFEYKTDGENFGREKVMFFEETLHYRYSDCEDRAIFFATLVRELLDLDLVFIKYPNHLATAIKLNSDIGGESIIYNNQRYYIADPTYSNANIGQAMPHIGVAIVATYSK
jgi:hypothetical protein